MSYLLVLIITVLLWFGIVAFAGVVVFVIRERRRRLLFAQIRIMLYGLIRRDVQ